MADAASKNRKSTARPVSRPLARWLHRWLGLTVGLVFTVVAASGSLLAFAPELDGWLYPAIDGPPPEDWVAERGVVMAAIEARHEPGEILVVRFPGEEIGAYEVWLADETRRYYHASNADLLLERGLYADMVTIAHELHVHLLAGEPGELVNGWLALVTTAMLVAGLWVWWPRRGAWRASLLPPPKVMPLRWHLHYWHRTVGAAVAGLLLFLVVTGAALVFYMAVSTVVTGLLGGGEPELPSREQAATESTDWPATLATLDETLPEARAVFYYPPSAMDGTRGFRKKLPDELHPNGRSWVVTDADGTLLLARDATEAAPGQKTMEALYPLHAGRAGSELWRWVAAIAGVLPLGFLVTGVLLWWPRRPWLKD